MFWIFFVPLMFIVSISLMNLVLALIVEVSMDSSANEKADEKDMKAKQFRRQLPTIKKIFSSLDTDGSGSITMNELESIPAEVKTALLKVVPSDDMVSIFEIVDEDGTGEVHIDEFCDSLEKVVSSDVPIETLRLIQNVSITRHEVRRVREYLAAMKEQTANGEAKEEAAGEKEENF